ncbi:MAG: hypothetical protein UW65_C0004G0017 [candidate division WWE3 bacterium GW2011_GWB1_44_4]|uniref:5'-3' exonuclease domain-containing protein n=1 Tax=candidate division WWE3 bacterium GW2011_GWB1_44_4 TaxID=1619116 RepID=A0A0G1MDN4_UNCKA|nr:MAG: hypothetical protein UW65_C0004G0017 [candidate division WWE3 bacterium GW2011_GWB1_44_4]
MAKLLILDLFNLIHRAYHALPKEFTDKNGNPTNAIYGVSSMLLTVLNQVHPTYVVAVVDTEKPTFRHEAFTGYKAHRRPMEDLLSVQIPKVLELVNAFKIQAVSAPGYEADDLVAAIATKHKKANQVIVFSNDRDLWQLVQPNVVIMLPSTKGDKIEWVGEKEVIARLGVLPNQVPDYKGLVGDSKHLIINFAKSLLTVSLQFGDLLKKYSTIENIYRHVGEVTPDSLREKLVNGYDQAVMSKKLATLDYNTPADFSLEASRYGNLPIQSVSEALQSYNFKSLLKRVGVEPSVREAAQKGLFD